MRLASFLRTPFRRWPTSEEVLKGFDLPDDVEIIGIVVDEKGAQRAIATKKVRTLGFPYSISPTFLEEQ